MVEESDRENDLTNVLKKLSGQARWLMPVILAFGKLRWTDHLRSGDRDQRGQHGETMSLLKIKKLAGHDGRHM